MIEAISLTKKYKDHLALDQLNLSVKPGEIYCLLGANGAGKSTTINLFLNFIKPTTGIAKIDGQVVSENPEYVRSICTYIPENLNLYSLLTGIENLDFFYNLSKDKKNKEELRTYLIKAGLQTSFIDKPVKEYSKGMRQKVGIALALAKNSKVVLLDEPTSGLDPKASNDFGEILNSFKEQNVAVLMATHDLFRAKETGTHMGIMKEGKLQTNFATETITISELEKLYLNFMR